ncbi:prefoldin subunit 4-like [Watersipora subatra]|uniref:prefoldin subunit 4-like n=1 Tax=Watersipora subatra TaxID=2589382 RepID=UPI00355AE109
MASVVGQSVKDNEIHITFEDQQQINCFARNNLKLGDINDEIEMRKKEQENYRDAVDEIMMLEGDDEMVPYQIGEAFFSKSAEAATEHLEKAQKEIDAEIDALNTRAEEIKNILSDLKVQLYAKFGNNINLENEEKPV